MPERPDPRRLAGSPQRTPGGGPGPRPPGPRPPWTPSTPTRHQGPDGVVGPHGSVVSVSGATLQSGGSDVGEDANALILLRRLAFWLDGGLADNGEKALLSWAVRTGAGQDTTLVRAVAERRRHAVASLGTPRRRHDRAVSARRVLLTPEWRLVTGIGERGNPHEVGIALHGTYGWPVIPGSTLKGAARAWAVDQGQGGVDRVCGPPPTAGVDGRAGTVTFLDALPAGDPVTLVKDVVTPHHKGYHRGGIPGEWENPEPAPFLAVSEGPFAADVVGPREDVDLAVAWLRGACDDLGVGAKTAGGYGYLTVSDAGRDGA